MSYNIVKRMSLNMLLFGNRFIHCHIQSKRAPILTIPTQQNTTSYPQASNGSGKKVPEPYLILLAHR